MYTLFSNPWIDESGWREKRTVKNGSQDAMINRLLVIVDDLMNKEDFAENINNNCNAIAKLIRQIKSLKNSMTNNDRFQTMMEFTDWLIIESRSDREIDEKLIKKINQLNDEFSMTLSDAGWAILDTDEALDFATDVVTDGAIYDKLMMCAVTKFHSLL